MPEVANRAVKRSQRSSLRPWGESAVFGGFVHGLDPLSRNDGRSPGTRRWEFEELSGSLPAEVVLGRLRRPSGIAQ